MPIEPNITDAPPNINTAPARPINPANIPLNSTCDSSTKAGANILQATPIAINMPAPISMPFTCFSIVPANIEIIPVAADIPTAIVATAAPHDINVSQGIPAILTNAGANKLTAIAIAPAIPANPTKDGNILSNEPKSALDNTIVAAANALAMMPSDTAPNIKSSIDNAINSPANFPKSPATPAIVAAIPTNAIIFCPTAVISPKSALLRINADEANALAIMPKDVAPNSNPCQSIAKNFCPTSPSNHASPDITPATPANANSCPIVSLPTLIFDNVFVARANPLAITDIPTAEAAITFQSTPANTFDTTISEPATAIIAAVIVNAPFQFAFSDAFKAIAKAIIIPLIASVEFCNSFGSRSVNNAVATSSKPTPAIMDVIPLTLPANLLKATRPPNTSIKPPTARTAESTAFLSNSSYINVMIATAPTMAIKATDIN